MTNANRVLTPGDLETIERVLYKNADDLSVALGRSFERLEECLDSMESRLYSRITDLEDMIATKCV